jgi:hypothetical protein
MFTPDPGSGSASKNLNNIYPKNCWGGGIRIFSTILDGLKVRDPGSGSATLVVPYLTGTHCLHVKNRSYNFLAILFIGSTRDRVSKLWARHTPPPASLEKDVKL